MSDLIHINNKLSDNKCLAIIPARGGSKRIPKKNICLLDGRPLIAWTIESALNCPFIDRVIVSTESEEIREISRMHGADAPFLRPKQLAQDDTPDLPVYRHVVSWLWENDGYYPDSVAWLRPTAPLRTTEDIKIPIGMLASTGADCVRSVTEVEHHPYWMKNLEGDRLVPFIAGKDEHTYFQHQLLPTVYRLNGAVDITRCQQVMERNVLYGDDMRGYPMPLIRSIDIDTELDWAMVELLLQQRSKE